MTSIGSPKCSPITPKPKPQNVIELSDSESESKNASSRSESRKRRPTSSLSSSPKRRSTSHDSDIKIIDSRTIRNAQSKDYLRSKYFDLLLRLIVPQYKSKSIRRLDALIPAIPAPNNNVFANVLVKPEVHVGQKVRRPALDGGALRTQFLRNLAVLEGPRVTVHNDIDHTSPPSDFVFINRNKHGKGVIAMSEDFMSGCSCRKDNGRHIGCEHLSCQCVQRSDPNENGRKLFPYSAADHDRGCLRGGYLKLRNHIYECNDFCNCDNDCKNRLVQHGRQIPLEIFKTHDRGWGWSLLFCYAVVADISGLRCPVKLLRGQFIDTYRGEVITDDESIERGAIRARDLDSNNYLFALDKFCEPPTITKADFRIKYPEKKAWHREQVKNGDYEITRDKNGVKLYLNPIHVPPKYTIDSKTMGAPTRFINHSCDPNCAIYTVSYNHNDGDLYELAFFATEDIPAGTELTFNYKDDEETEVITEAMANALEAKNGERPVKCLCGTQACRGYFFHF